MSLTMTQFQTAEVEFRTVNTNRLPDCAEAHVPSHDVVFDDPALRVFGLKIILDDAIWTAGARTGVYKWYSARHRHHWAPHSESGCASPPDKMFSPAASRKQSVIVIGPFVLFIQIACASLPDPVIV